MILNRIMSVVSGLAVVLAGVRASGQPAGVTGYEVTSLGVAPGQTTSNVQGIDDFARVVGESGSLFPTPFVWINGELIVIPAPQGHRRPRVTAIGDGGVIVGFSTPLESSNVQPTAWTISQGIHVLPILPGASEGVARCVNDHRWPQTVIAGSSTAGVTYATLWLGSMPSQIGGPRSGADAVNYLGHAAGSARNQLNIQRPTLWRDGKSIDIGGEPETEDGYASSVSDADEVVGDMDVPRRAFYWFNGERTTLPDIYACGGATHARAISNIGLIAGQAGAADCGAFHAAVWDRNQGLRGFIVDEFTPRHPDIDLLSAEDINDAGQIASFGEYDDGRERGFLVTPYLFEMSDPVPGRAGTMNTITVTGLQPNQRVHLVWGTREGAQKIRGGCAGGTLLIRDPQALQAVRADANGVATITINVPLIARGRTVRLQAVAPIECQISHTVTWTFE